MIMRFCENILHFFYSGDVYVSSRAVVGLENAVFSFQCYTQSHITTLLHKKRRKSKRESQNVTCHARNENEFQDTQVKWVA